MLLDRSWLATVRDVSGGTHHVISPSRPSPAFRTASDKSWAWRPGNEATAIPTACYIFNVFITFIVISFNSRCMPELKFAMTQP